MVAGHIGGSRGRRRYRWGKRHEVEEISCSRTIRIQCTIQNSATCKRDDFIYHHKFHPLGRTESEGINEHIFPMHSCDE